MDALSHRFNCLSLITLVLGLSGCQSAPTGLTDADLDALGRKELDAALLDQPDPDSIVRDGDRVTYVVSAGEGRIIHHLARFDADCHLPDAQMAYLTTAGMQRFAVDSRGTTPEGQQMPAAEKNRYLQSAQLKQVCAEVPVPQWRVIAAPDQEDWHLIDRASLSQKDGQVVFWSARVPAMETLLPSDEGLYAQTRQRWSANCAREQLTSLSTFYVSQQNVVREGSVSQQARPLKNLDADQRQLLKVACGTTQALDQYKPFQGRTQTPFVLPDPVLPSSIVKSIEALKLPAPQQNLQHLRVSFHDFHEPDRGRFGRLGRDTNYLAYQPGKQMTERYNGQQRQFVKLSFRGLIPLAEIDYTHDRYGTRVNRDAITDLRFTGDWATLPVGAQLSYTEQRSFTPYEGAPKLTDRTFACEVQSHKSASELYPTLTGMANVIRCTGEYYRHGLGTGTYAYLQNYGLFVPIDFQERSAYGQFKILMAD